MTAGTRPDYTYAATARRSGSASVRWNAVAMVGRQGAILVFSVFLARLLGPTSYGVVAQASVYITLTTLLLDQGLSASLISQHAVSRRAAGTAVTVNLLLALVFAAVTVPLAEPLAVFLHTPELVLVLPVLGAGLLLKAAQIVPRMLLMRTLDFRAIAVSDVGSAVAGGILGVVAGLIGFGYWAIVVQLVSSDLLAAIVLIVAARPPLPALAFRSLAGSAGFGARVFTGNLLSFVSRNIDNLLVGRFFGPTQLAYYSLAYRVLLSPVQMVGQVVTRVLFPAISRVRDDHARVSALTLRCIRAIAFVSFPFMAFVAVSAPDTVVTVLGPRWLPAVLVLQILAVTGARQAVTSINGSVLLGMARSDLHLRFNIAAAVVQVGGIVAGLPFGIVGVATGYTIAGLVLTPVIGWLQKHLVGTSYTAQAGSVLPALHGAAWLVAVYLLLDLTPIGAGPRIAIGLVAGVAAYALVLRFVHPRTWRAVVADGRGLLPDRRAARV